MEPQRSTKERLGLHLETEYGTLIRMLGDNFHSVVLRMAVQIERIAMILTAMRLKQSEVGQKELGGIIECSDTDYQTAELIGNKLLLNMAVTYRMIEGDKQDLVPEIKPLDQRKVLFEQLKTIYERKELIQEAKTQGISERTAERWNDKWQESGLVIKLEHGKYKKIG